MYLRSEFIYRETNSTGRAHVMAAGMRGVCRFAEVCKMQSPEQNHVVTRPFSEASLSQAFTRMWDARQAESKATDSSGFVQKVV